MNNISDNPFISVIIPVYNAKSFLARCLDSVLGNTYRNIEVILVDDGSTDNSGKICDEYAEKDSRVRVIHNENGGTARARNTALEVAEGKFIAFADDDDFIHPRFYEYMLNSILSTGSDIVVCEMTREMNEQVFYKKTYDNIKPEIVDKKSFIYGTYSGDWTRNTAPWNKIYKRELFDTIRFPNGKGYEDAFTTYKLIFKAHKICYIEAEMYYWYNNELSYSSKKDDASKLLFREEALYLQANYYQEESYRDILYCARKFYLEQIYLMLWQIKLSYKKSDINDIVYKYFIKKISKYYIKYSMMCNRKEKLKYFEIIHPCIGGKIVKILNRRSK